MNDELRSVGGVRARGILLLVAVAIAGGAAGGAIDRWWTMRDGAYGGFVTAEPGVGFLRRGEGGAAERLRVRNVPEDGIPFSLRAVNLTDEQKARIREITARFQPAAESLMRNVRPRVMELNLRMQQAAMCVLTQAQRDEWLAWRKREGLSVEEGEAMLKLANSGGCGEAPTKP